MPIEGGDIRIFTGQTYKFDLYDIEAHAAGVSRKYGIEVTPAMLEQAQMSQDTHLGGCHLFTSQCTEKESFEIVRDRLLAIGRAQQTKGFLDYFFDGVEWLAGKISSLFAALRGRRRAPQATTAPVVTSRVVGYSPSPEASSIPAAQVVQLQTPEGPIPVRLNGPAALLSPGGARAQAAAIAPAPAVAPSFVQGGLQMVAPAPRVLVPLAESFFDVP
jgi:hypothetical protein